MPVQKYFNPFANQNQPQSGNSYFSEPDSVNNEELMEKIRKLEAENFEKEAELERIRKDQDDLLELLTDQELKLTSFKNRLTELGETIEDGESENENENER